MKTTVVKGITELAKAARAGRHHFPAGGDVRHIPAAGRAAAVDKVELRARVKGYLGPRLFTDGGLVKEGEVLFRIEPDTYLAAVDQKTAQRDAAKAEKLRIRPVQESASHAEFVAEAARQLIFNQYGDEAYSRGLNVYLTLNSAEQNSAYRALRRGILDYEKRQVYRGPEAYADLPGDNKELDTRIAEALGDHPANDELLAAVVLVCAAAAVMLMPTIVRPSLTYGPSQIPLCVNSWRHPYTVMDRMQQAIAASVRSGQYGALLFDIDSKRRKALSVYRQAHDADPEDNRTWMPLYFLLLEFGTPEQRLKHLREIVRKLVNDPRPLKAFPITIESLEQLRGLVDAED